MNFEQYSLPKLAIVPARVLQTQVEAGLPIASLVQLHLLERIIKPDDLVFYKYINENRRKVLDKILDDSFRDIKNVFKDNLNIELKTQPIKEITDKPSNLFDMLAVKDPKFKHYHEFNRNNYVEHYFEIDRSTIGVMFAFSANPITEKQTSIRSLMALLANTYLGDVGGIASLRNDSHIVNLMSCPLFSNYLRK